MKVAWFSVLNNNGLTSSPSAYFSDQLLGPLSKEFEIDLYVDELGSYKGKETYHYLSAFERHAEKNYDVFFYQMEDSKAAHFCRLHLGLLPGIVLFHDFTLKDAGPEPLHNSAWYQNIKKFLGFQKDWPNLLEEQFQAHPLAAREGAFSVIPIFTSPKDHADFKRTSQLNVGYKVQSGRSYYLPYPVSIAKTKVGQTPSPQLQIAFCGTPGIEHRAAYLLQALDPLGNQVKLHWLVNDTGEEALAHELLKEFKVSDVSIYCDRTPQCWEMLVAECNMAVHTFFSAYGQIGPYLQISLAHGLPCIVTDYGASDYIPDHIVLKVRPGLRESEEISRAIELVRNGQFTTSKIKAYARETYDVSAVAADLTRIFKLNRAILKGFYSEWSKFELEASTSNFNLI